VRVAAVLCHADTCDAVCAPTPAAKTHNRQLRSAARHIRAASCTRARVPLIYPGDSRVYCLCVSLAPGAGERARSVRAPALQGMGVARLSVAVLSE